jgi:hypothetical protein
MKRFFQPKVITHGGAWLLAPATTMLVGQGLNLDGDRLALSACAFPGRIF